jgi:hypothetical protein
VSRPAYGLKGDFQFVEATMGQIVNFLVIEKENAIEIANQFFRELDRINVLLFFDKGLVLSVPLLFLQLICQTS